MIRLEPSRDMPLLARWLPDLLARSPPIVRGTGTPGHSGSTASAHGGRLDHIDESNGYSRAVEVWRRLRAIIAAGHGGAVASLWTAHTLAQLHEEPGRHHAALHDAVALGAAPRVLRDDWRLRAGETDRTRKVVSKLVLRDGVDEDGAPKHREVPFVSTAILSTKGPPFEALAVAWGAERLGPLWAPGAVPLELALGAATGFAPADVRARWGKLRTVMRDAAARSWGEAWLRSCSETLRNEGSARDRVGDA